MIDDHHTEGESELSTEAVAPRVFMSYSHDSADHKGWVLQLATRLMSNGVDVVLDQWSLSLGRNLPLFMESGLTSSERVLVISSTNYVTKANKRDGGAGYETMILSADMMGGDIHKDRIIPVVRNNTGGSAVPTFLSGALYVDMRDDSQYEDRYEELLRTLLGVPKAVKPELGSNPFRPREGELYVSPSMRPERYVSPALAGEVVFPYSNNSGGYVIGAGEMAFTTKWSESGFREIYAYKDGAGIHSVALAPGITSFDDLGDASWYDASSRTRTASVGDAVIFRNVHDYFAAVLVDEVTTRGTSASGGLGELRFRYRIQDNRTSFFGPPGQTSR